MNRAERGVIEILRKRAASREASQRDQLFRQAYRVCVSTGRIRPSFLLQVDKVAFNHAKRCVPAGVNR